MVAARKFNLQKQSPDRAVHGIVTTGMLWRFMRLDGTKVSVDAVEYPIQSSRKIFGILTAIALEGAGYTEPWLECKMGKAWSRIAWRADPILAALYHALTHRPRSLTLVATPPIEMAKAKSIDGSGTD
jgi:hypothetical protein